MPDLPYKPDWIESVRATVNPRLLEAYEPGVMLLHALAIYERADELGGQSMSRVLKHMKEFREALGAVCI